MFRFRGCLDVDREQFRETQDEGIDEAGLLDLPMDITVKRPRNTPW